MVLLRLFLFGLLTASCYACKKKSTKSSLTQTTELDPTVTSYLMYHITDGPPVTVAYVHNFRTNIQVVPLVDVPNAVKSFPQKARDLMTKTNIPMSLTALNLEVLVVAEIVQREISAAQATPHLYDSSLLASLSKTSTWLSIKKKVMSEIVSEMDAGQTPAWWIQPERGDGSTSAYQVGTIDPRIGAGEPRCAFALCNYNYRNDRLFIEGYETTATVTPRAALSTPTVSTSNPSIIVDPISLQCSHGSCVAKPTLTHSEVDFVSHVVVEDAVHGRVTELPHALVESPSNTPVQVTPPPADSELHERGTPHKHCRGLPGWNGHGGRSDCYVSSCMAQYEGNMTLYGVHTYLNDKGISTTSRFTSTIEGPHWGIDMPNLSTTHGWGAHRTVEPWRPECTDRESCRERCAKMVERGFRFGWIIIAVLLGLTAVALTGIFCCMCCQDRREVNGNDRPDDQRPDDQTVERAPRGRRQERGSVFASGTDNAADQPGDVRARNVVEPAEA